MHLYNFLDVIQQARLIFTPPIINANFINVIFHPQTSFNFWVQLLLQKPKGEILIQAHLQFNPNCRIEIILIKLTYLQNLKKLCNQIAYTYYVTIHFINSNAKASMNRLLSLQQALTSSEPQSFFITCRRSSTINLTELKRLVYGPNYEERDRAMNYIKAHPEVYQHFHLTEATRQHQRQSTTRQLIHLSKAINSIQKSDNPNQFSMFGNGATFFDLNLTTKIGVHYSLYLKTIERLGTTKKHQYFYNRACNFQDFGCFALTELMHGSNVRGLLTEAHYDHNTKQIILHSPTKDAMKFWIGGSGKTSNMCVLWAQLYVKGKCQGVHAIITPLRDQITHQVLPGITIGDCGPKFGLNAVDNGFILFQNFRIPVENLLNKVSGVNEKGEFFSVVDSQNKRFGMTLAALSQGRFFMCCHSSSLAISALAIAIRYTFVRQQFSSGIQNKENFLIEYPLTKRRIIPLLALQVVLMFASMNTFYAAQNNPEKNSLNPSNPILKQIHAISSVLKTKTAWAATQVIRQCRQMMGGHGYSAYSKMSALYGNNDVNNTWQGQNNVLIQQTTKYVMQNFQKAMTGKQIKSPLLKYFQNPPETKNIEINREFLLDLNKIKQHLMFNIYSKAQELGTKMVNLKQKKMPSVDIWNHSQVYLGQTLAMMTGDLFILDLCEKKMSGIQDQKTKVVFKNIVCLWVLLILKQDQSIGQEHHAQIQKTISQFCNLLFPEVLGILQAVAAGEDILGSPFANEKGEGFDKYLNMIMKHPKNQRATYWQLVSSK